MAKDTRLQFRVSAAKKERLKRCAAKVRLKETALGEAAVDALCDYIEKYGEITSPFILVPESKVASEAHQTHAPPHTRSTISPFPEADPSSHPLSSRLNEPGATPHGSAHSTNQPKTSGPKITKTRAKLRAMAKGKTTDSMKTLLLLALTALLL